MTSFKCLRPRGLTSSYIDCVNEIYAKLRGISSILDAEGGMFLDDYAYIKGSTVPER
jgi:hypothetical protein